MSNQRVIYSNTYKTRSFAFHQSLHFRSYGNLGGFQSGLKGNYFIQRCIHSPDDKDNSALSLTEQDCHNGATALTVRSPPPPPSLVSSLRFLSATLLFLPTTLVPSHPCKVRMCSIDLSTITTSFQSVPRRGDSQPIFPYTCLQQPLAWLSRFLDLPP